MHAIMNDMVVTFTLFLLAVAPQTAALTGEWLLTWDQMGTQYIRVSVTQEGAAARVTWENESIEWALTDNVWEGADPEGQFTFIEKPPPAPPPGGSRTHKFEPIAFYNYFAWNIAPALHIF